MFQLIEVIRQIDELHRQVWRFNFMDRECQLRVDHYALQHRPTKRHKYRTTEYYDFYSGSRGIDRIPSKEIPLPEDVVAEARREFYNKLTVVIRHDEERAHH